MDDEIIKRRIELMNEAIMLVARGDYSVQVELSEEHNDLDALAMGLNMMIDELRYNYNIGAENEKIKLLNKQLREAQRKAEESDRLKTAFLANMSHEIRTPLNGILGFSDLLKNPDLKGDKQQEYIGIIEKSGMRMLNIINDIVDISKIEAGLMELHINESNINEQIKYIYSFFKPEVEEKGMMLSFKNSLPAEAAIIQTDREKIYAVLTNLVKNAIKYSDEGTIEFGYDKKGDYLEFYVKDTGIGIPKHRQEAIFNRFIQADSENKMAKQGSGLGLSISKAYVEMLGGKIWVESEEGKGSIFFFTLPHHIESAEKIDIQNKVASSMVSNMTAPQISELKVLIAEDDEISNSFISIILDPLCREIITTKNGAEAIEMCRNNPDIDLILMDIQMPVIDGYLATKQIRQFNKEVIIFAQTAFGLSDDSEKAIEAGCNDYIAKPIKKDKLNALIQKYFKK